MKKTTHTEDYKKVIEGLKQSRLESGLSQQEVAGRLNKPQSYISKIESGERRLDVVEIQALAKIYKKKISYFVE